MIAPVTFTLKDFISEEMDPRMIKSLEFEALSGGELIDNLILLRFCDLSHIKTVLHLNYNMRFAWLNMDVTPPEYRDIADKHNIIIERGREFVIYVPLSVTLDEATLQVDIPDYVLNVRFIADCNYKLVRAKRSPNILFDKMAQFRPLLVFRRLIIDCISSGGTDIHFESGYVDKRPSHKIVYRVKRELTNSPFILDFDLTKKVIQNVIGKLSTSSTLDIDASAGIVTEVRDLFNDGTCDLRITCTRVDAGYYMVCAIQTTDTTLRKIDELGFPKEDVTILRQLSQRRTGLTLVTGEMRSGKNTTIFAILNEIIDEPIRIIEYSNPIENHMPFPQINYRGDIDILKDHMTNAKKQDIDIAVLNEIPNAAIAFAVRDLVNSAIGVITTTHVNRAWHVPNKLHEFFGDDYKTIVSQLNAVINHKVFRRWTGPGMQKRMLVKEQGPFEMFCYTAGVRQYFVPLDPKTVKYAVQPLTEIFIFDDAIKSAMLNFTELWRAEQMIQLKLQKDHCTLENKVAQYINEGLMSIEEMRHLY